MNHKDKMTLQQSELAKSSKCLQKLGLYGCYKIPSLCFPVKLQWKDSNKKKREFCAEKASPFQDIHFKM